MTRPRRNVLDSATRRRRRMRRRLQQLGGVLAIIVVLVALFSWLSHYDAFEISIITIDGNDALTTQEITEVVNAELDGSYAFLFSKRNIAIFPRFAIAEALRTAYPRIKTLDVEIYGLNEIGITLTERETHSVWCKKESMEEASREEAGEEEGSTAGPQCVLLDPNGFAFAESPGFSRDVYVTIYGTVSSSSPSRLVGRQLVEPLVFHRLLAFRERFADAGFPAYAIVERAHTDHALLLESGGEIRVDRRHKPDRIVRSVMLAVEQKKEEHPTFRDTLEYVDARFVDHDRVYFKFSN